MLPTAQSHDRISRSRVWGDGNRPTKLPVEPDCPAVCKRRMRRASTRGSMVAITIAAIVATALSGTAFAKGPSQAVIEGPGLAHPVRLRDTTSRTIGPYLASMVQ